MNFNKREFLEEEQDNKLQKLIDDAIEGIMRTRNTHLEMFAAAFLQHVGSKEAAKYTLVEHRSEDMRTTTWTFKLTEDLDFITGVGEED